MTEKKTKIMYFEEIRDLIEDVEFEDEAQQTELIEFVDKQIETLIARKEAAAKRAEKKRQESDELTDKIYELISDEYITVDAIVDALGDEEVTRNKVTARLGKLVRNGLVEKAKIKIEGVENKKMAYVRAGAVDAESAE